MEMSNEDKFGLPAMLAGQPEFVMGRFYLLSNQ
jgi:hypothetical protein